MTESVAEVAFDTPPKHVSFNCMEAPIRIDSRGLTASKSHFALFDESDQQSHHSNTLNSTWSTSFYFDQEIYSNKDHGIESSFYEKIRLILPHQICKPFIIHKLGLASLETSDDIESQSGEKRTVIYSKYYKTTRPSAFQRLVDEARKLREPPNPIILLDADQSRPDFPTDARVIRPIRVP